MPAKEKTDLKELEQQSEDGYSIYHNKNHLSTLNKDTEIAVVGSFIPQDLIYFYNKNPYIYVAIDEARKTYLAKYKKKYTNNISTEEKERIINDIRRVLNEQKIAFVDLFEFVLIKTNSSRDRDIKGYTIDQKVLRLLLKHQSRMKIITVTEFIESILLEKDVKNKYVKLFQGRSKRYPKGTNYRKLWKDVFDKRYLDNNQI